MSRRSITLAVLASAVLASGIFLTPADASFPNYSLITNSNGSGGTATAGNINYRATQNTQLTLRDVTGTPSSLVCAASTGSLAAGSFRRGYNQAGPIIGTIAATRFGSGTGRGQSFAAGLSPCTASAFPASVQQQFTWLINITGGSTPVGSIPVSGQTTPTSITSIRAHIALRTGSNPVTTCEFDVGGNSTSGYGTATSPVTPSAGTVLGKYLNGNGFSSSPSTLQVAPNTGNLHAFNAPTSGCSLGAIRSGDAFSFEGATVNGLPQPATFVVSVDNFAAPSNPFGTADQIALSVG